MRAVFTENKRYFLSEKAIKEYYERFLFQEHEDAPWDIFVLINRKGYWDYKIFFPEFSNYNKNDCGKLVVSDRYLEKLPNDKLQILLKGKKVIIYDDSLTNGSNLFFYFMLCHFFGAEQVTPVVYALHSKFPSDKAVKLMRREAKRFYDDEVNIEKIDNLIQEFIDRLSYKLLLSSSDIDRMSIWQTQIFQKNISPLVMDLPMINRVEGQEKGKILLSKEVFQYLLNYENEIWTFVDNKMHWEGHDVITSYFHMEDELLYGELSDILHDFVVKCKYEYVEDKIMVAFTPFAIVKSIGFEKVFRLFEALYKDTAYGKDLLQYFDDNMYVAKVMEKDHNLCRAMFRAVIYYFSGYIGEKFRRFVKNVINIELEYDKEIMSDNFDDVFIQTEMELQHSFDELKFKNALSFYKAGEVIAPISTREYAEEPVRRANQERTNLYIRSSILEKKSDADAPLKERIYTLETMEYELKNRFLFSGSQELRQMMTSGCLLFLGTNSFSNMIYIDNGEQVLYRGFRYGENSDIFLHEDLWFFYAYLYAFYMEVGTARMKEKYESFMGWLVKVLKKKDYWNKWISEDAFCYLRDYFEACGDKMADEIMRRIYLLDVDKCGKESEIRTSLIKEAREIVRQWEEV